MSIEQLRQAVEEIHDTLIRLKRVYDVMLENTNDSFNNSLKNITLTVDKLLVNSSKTNDIGEQLESYFTVSADKIESKVMKSVNGQLVNYSTVEQTAEMIKSEVANSGDISELKNSVNNINNFINGSAETEGTLEKKLASYSTVTQTDEKIENVVASVNKINNNLTINYSTTNQTSEQITNAVAGFIKESDISELRTTVNDVDNFINGDAETDGTLKNKFASYSTTEQTANYIAGQLAGYYKTGDFDYTQLATITYTDDKLQSVYATSYDLNSYFLKTSMPTKDNTDDAEKRMLCKYNNKYYYYNSLSEEWKETAGIIYTKFEQTSNGFKLIGNVKIDGSLITSGTISGERLRANKLYSQNGGYYGKMYSEWGDFGIYNGNAGDEDDPTSSNCVWGVYHSDLVTGAVNHYCYSKNYFGYNYSQGIAYPKGTWKFQDCTVTHLSTKSTVYDGTKEITLEDYVKNNAGSGSATAVFG